MLRKLRLRQKNGFLIKKNVYSSRRNICLSIKMTNFTSLFYSFNNLFFTLFNNDIKYPKELSKDLHPYHCQSLAGAQPDYADKAKKTLAPYTLRTCVHI